MGIIIYRDSPRGSRLLGRIDYEIEKDAEFQYDKSYLDEALLGGELGISERLPLDALPYSPADFAPFFRGLLPEGETHQGLIDMYRIPGNDYLSLLERLGCESIGALTFVSEDANPDEYVQRYAHLESGSLALLKESPTRGVISAVSETRLSLSGAQSKIAWFLQDGKDMESATLGDWLVPRGAAPSTHIIKLSRKGEEDIARNELACAKLSAACGFPTAQAALLPDLAGALCVRRYDRPWIGEGDDRRILRLHQEDFCQALGLSPYQKYQPDGVEGSYLCMIAELLEGASDNPIIDKQEFAKRLLFNYVVGNTDAHLKNSSLLYNIKWTGKALAPMYDVTCIPLTGYSTKMAFAIGEHRELSRIDERDLMSIPLDMDIALSAFDKASSEVLAALESYDARSDEPDTARMIERILTDAKPRMEVVKRYLGI